MQHYIANKRHQAKKTLKAKFLKPQSISNRQDSLLNYFINQLLVNIVRFWPTNDDEPRI